MNSPDHSALCKKLLVDVSAIFYDVAHFDKIFFGEIVKGLSTLINQIEESKSNRLGTIKILCSLFKSFSKLTTDIIDHEDMAICISSFLADIVSNPIISSCSIEASSFVLSLISNFTQPHLYKELYFPFLSDAFENEQFVIDFESLGGVGMLINSLSDKSSTNLIQIVFTSLTKTANVLTTSNGSNTNSFIDNISVCLFSILPENVLVFWHFLYSYFNSHSQSVFFRFLDIKCFQNINSLIIKYQNPQFLAVYSFFLSNSFKYSFGNGNNSIIDYIVLLIVSPHLNSSIREEIMKILSDFVIFYQGDEPPITISGLSSIVSMIHPVEQQSLSSFLKIFDKLVSKYQIITEPLFLSLLSFINSNSLLSEITDSILSIFTSVPKNLIASKLLVFDQIIEASNSFSFCELFLKFDTMITAYVQSVSLLKNIDQYNCYIEKLIQSGLHQKGKMKFIYIVQKIIAVNRVPEVFISLLSRYTTDIDLIISSLFGFSKFVEKSLQVGSDFLSGIVFLLRSVTVRNENDINDLFDLLGDLSCHVFQVQFDKDVYSLLEDCDYFGATSDQIHKLAFGVNHLKENFAECHLCFPSILYKCPIFKIRYHYDMWVCSQYAIDEWMKKTYKQITGFPCIDIISRRFCKQSHALLLFEHPDVCINCVGSHFNEIPLFEFTKGFNDSKIIIPGPKKSSDSVGIQFWVFFQNGCSEKQQIFNYGSISLFVEDSIVYYSDQIIYKTLKQKWYLITMNISEESVFSIYINEKYCGDQFVELSDRIEIGASVHVINWYIGGSIRLYKDRISSQIINTVISIGPSDSSSVSTSEYMKISPSNYISFEKGYYNGVTIPSKRIMPVLSHPLSHYVLTRYNGVKGLLFFIIEHLSSLDNYQAINFIIFIIRLQKCGVTNISPLEFSYLIGAVLSSSEGLLGKELVDSVVQCFFNENDNQLDHKAFLSFFMNFSILSSPIKEDIFKLLIGIITNLPSNNASPDFLDFWFFLVSLASLNPDDPLILAYCARLLDSTGVSLHFLVQWVIYFQDHPFYPFLFASLIDHIDSSFSLSCIYYCLNSNDSIILLYKFISSINNFEAIPNQTQLLLFCTNNPNNILSWNVALSLLLSKHVDIRNSLSFTFDEAKTDLLPYFFIMVGFILSIETFIDPYFESIRNSIVGFIKLLSSDFIINHKYVFGLVNLLSFGQFSDECVVFPFAPSFYDPNQVIAFGKKRGQNFPQEPVQVIDMEYPFISLSETKRFDPLDFFDLNDDELIKPNSFENMRITWNSYHMSKVREFGTKWTDVDNIEKSILFLDIVEFVTDVLISQLNNSSNFSLLLSQITLYCGFFVPKQSHLIMTKLVFNLLTSFDIKNLYSTHLIEFVCSRAFEGWFCDSYSPVISYLLSIFRKSGEHDIPDILIRAVFNGFDIVKQSQLPIFIELFINYFDCIFDDSILLKPNYCLFIVDKLLIFYQLQKESIGILFNSFFGRITTNTKLRFEWEKCPYSFFSYDSFVSIINAISTNGIKGFEKWHIENQIESSLFDQARLSVIKGFTDTSNIQTQALLESLRNNRMEFTFALWKDANLFITSCMELRSFHDEMNIILNRKCKNEITRCINNFFRIREIMLTENLAFGNVVATSIVDSLIPPYNFGINQMNLPDDVSFVIHPPLYLPKTLLSQLSCPSTLSVKNESYVIKCSYSFVCENTNQNSFDIFAKYFENNNFQWIQDVSIAFYNEPIHGCFFVNNSSLFFALLRNTDFSIQKDVDKSLIEDYWMEIYHNRLCDYFLYEGYPILNIQNEDILSINRNGADQFEFYISLVSGSSFMIRLSNQQTLESITTYMKLLVNRNFAHFPNDNVSFSHFNNAKILLSQERSVYDKWMNCRIDNFTLLCYLNHQNGYHFCIPNHYPIMPSSSDIGYEKFVLSSWEELENFNGFQLWASKSFSIVPPLQKPIIVPFIHIASNPMGVFWHSIRTIPFSYPVKIKLCSDNVLIIDNLSVSLDDNINSVLIINKDKRSIFHHDPRLQTHSVSNAPQLQSLICSAVSDDYYFYALGHSCNSISLYKLIYNEGIMYKLIPIKSFMLNDSPKKILISSYQGIAYSICDSSIHRIHINSLAILPSFQLKFKLSDFCIDEYGFTIIISGSNYLCVLSLSGEVLSETLCEEQINCISCSLLPIHVKNRFFVTGHDQGFLCFWHYDNQSRKLTCLKKLSTVHDNILGLSIEPRSQRIAFITADAAYCASYFHNSAVPLQSCFADRCPSCGNAPQRFSIYCKTCKRYFCNECSSKKNLIKKEYVCKDCLSFVV